MGEKKEEIILDAVIGNAVDCAAFSAELANGHGFTAFVAAGDQSIARRLSPGITVQVSMSPFDMSKGQIIAIAGTSES